MDNDGILNDQELNDFQVFESLGSGVCVFHQCLICHGCGCGWMWLDSMFRCSTATDGTQRCEEHCSKEHHLWDRGKWGDTGRSVGAAGSLPHGLEWPCKLYMVLLCAIVPSQS